MEVDMIADLELVLPGGENVTLAIRGGEVSVVAGRTNQGVARGIHQVAHVLASYADGFLPMSERSSSAFSAGGRVVDPELEYRRGK